MYNFWHNEILGKYSPEDRWMGLDYRTLFLDPQRAKLTHIHELAHSVLSRSTDFGQATELIYQVLPRIKHIKPEEKDLIRKKLLSVQFVTQEGSACLMELLRLRSEIGRIPTLSWAKNNLTQKYYQITEKLFFVLEMSERYRNSFTMQIPHSAMHCGIKKAIVQQDLLSSADKFLKHLDVDDNNPDKRFQIMINKIRYQSHIPTKSPIDICRLTGIRYFPDVTKQDAADFINYLNKLSGNNTNISADQIRDSKDVDVLTEANDDVIIGNMNLNFPKDAMMLWKTEDLLHFKDKIEVVMVTRMNDDLEYRNEIEQLIGKKPEAALALFLKTGEKYMFGSDIPTISDLIKKELCNCTLITKWGLFRPGDKELLSFANSRKPDVVIYNSTKNMDHNFKEWLDQGNKVDLLYLGASQGHPFQTIIIKDGDNILHFVNTFNRPANDFMKRYPKTLVRAKPEVFLTSTRHFNNALAVWCGMPFEVDWYKSMLDGNNIFYR